MRFLDVMSLWKQFVETLKCRSACKPTSKLPLCTADCWIWTGKIFEKIELHSNT